jgi:hypothetical protein
MPINFFHVLALMAICGILIFHFRIRTGIANSLVDNWLIQHSYRVDNSERRKIGYWDRSVPVEVVAIDSTGKRFKIGLFVSMQITLSSPLWDICLVGIDEYPISRNLK